MRATVRFMPTQPRDSVIQALTAGNMINEAGKELLQQRLPGELPVTWNASEYLSISRSRGGSDGEVWKQVPKEFLKLSQIGFNWNLGALT
jgi:hypothetical protein